MQLGFYFDQTRCIGCFTCTIACKDWNDVPAGQVNWRRVETIERGKYPDVFVAFLSTSCYHCAEPPCVSACPVDAITKRKEDGIVVINQEKCLGKENCGLCWHACPYKAPQFGAEEDAKMQMCNLCLDRWTEGKQPICVAGCPMRALEAGPIDKLILKYGNTIEAQGFTYSPESRPSVIFKLK